jgi:hypothetical protein
MILVPADIPDTAPTLPTYAIVVTLLLQLPPVIGSARIMVEPTQTFELPNIVPATGRGLTVITTVATLSGK